jgi:hypothetical protein
MRGFGTVEMRGLEPTERRAGGGVESSDNNDIGSAGAGSLIAVRPSPGSRGPSSSIPLMRGRTSLGEPSGASPDRADSVSYFVDSDTEGDVITPR